MRNGGTLTKSGVEHEVVGVANAMQTSDVV